MMPNQTIKISSGKTLVLDEVRYKLLKSELVPLDISGLDDSQYVWNIPNGLVGQVSLEGFTINIMPSIQYLSTEDYLRLLVPASLRSKNINGIYDFKNGAETSSEIIKAFLFTLEQLISEGIPRKYNMETTQCQNFVGKVNIPATFIRSITLTPLPVVTQSDKLAINYPVMQVIKTAYSLVSSYSVVGRSRKIDAALANVKDNKESLKLTNKVRFLKTEGVLEYCFNLARQLLVGSKPNTGNKHDCTLLLNCNKIFEDYVSSLVLNSLAREHVSIHKELKLADYNNGEILADIDLVIDSATPIPADIKNKNFHAGVKNADLYQIITYSNILDTKVGILIYPTDETTTIPDVIITRGSYKVRVYKIGINISYKNNGNTEYSESEFIKQLQDIAYHA